MNLLLVIIMIGTFVARYFFTNNAFQHLLNIFTLLLPKDSKFLPTKYLFNKCLPKSQIKKNLFCPSSTGKLIEKDSSFIFPYDKKEHYHKTELVKKGCFYLFMSIANQLKVILECFVVGKYKKRIEGRNSLGNLIFEVCVGHNYSVFSNRRKGEYAISLLGSTDGVVTFKNTAISLWLVQFIVLELPPSDRKK